LSSPIYIDHEPGCSRSVKQATGGGKRLANQHILLKARSQSFYGDLIKGGEKPRKRRAVGQVIATKQSHEWFSKRHHSVVKGQQCGLTRKSVANEYRDEIDHVVVTKASAGETHLLDDSFEDALMGKDLREGYHLTHPGWG
jgi:hypothetical protein